MLRGALIGLGNIAVRGHIPAFLSDGVRSSMQIVAVCDLVEQNRARAAELLPGARFYGELNALLRSEEIDFADICTPPHTHADYLRACAAAGIDVICEKPLAERYDAVAPLRSALLGSNVAFVPCHQYKFSPLWRTIRDLIAGGDLGEVTLAQFGVYRLRADSGTAAWNPEWRTSRNLSGGGILVDTGAHYFYLAQYFFGMPLRIAATLKTLKHREYGVEDTALVTLEYPGSVMQISLTWAAAQRANAVAIAGTKANLFYDGRRLLRSDDAGVREIPMPDVSDKSQYVAWYASLFGEFLRRVRNNDASTDLLDEASNVMKLLDLSYRSSDEGRTLDVV